MGRTTAAAIDAALVVLFAAIGRASHNEEMDVIGVSTTAFPFLVAAALGWGVVLLRRREGAGVGDGLWIWLITLAIGMVLRRLLGDGTAGAFIIVAGITLALLLVGWRAVWALLTRRRRPSA
ncbi:MAG: DUF3054 domain-containing protein [Propionibacteriaceae bacterium]|nr:DUF3054 domain-containing protein [Propionibacteriaceae bacterium]